MADYYSPAVFTEIVGLTDLLRRTLEAQGATCYEDGEKETVLDAIINERPPITHYHVTFIDSWNSGYGAVEYLEDIDEEEKGELEKELGPEGFDELKRLLSLDSQDLLLEILKVDPDTETIEVQCGFNCSKMRTDGYGGYSLIANRKGYLHIGTTDFAIDDDGTIKPKATFTPWEDAHAIA